MACLLMWIASFIMLAIFMFWRYMGFTWFTRKDKDFLQVQSEHCKRLCNDIQSLEIGLKVMEASSKKKVFNKNQCVHLFCKLVLAMKGINKMLSSATRDLKFQSILEELCHLQKRIEIVRKNCINQERWCHLVVFQLQNKETFRELLLDLKCCYETTCDMYLFHHPNQSNDILPIQFDVATYEQVIEDEQELKRKLELVLQGEISEDYEIVQHLLLRLRNLDQVDGGDLNTVEVPNDFKTPQLIQKIGKGGYGNVYKSNWLGLVCATKVLKGNREYLMNSQKEVEVLIGLSHPNLVQLFCCGITQEIDENPKEDETGEMHLVMELMDSNLSTILKKAKRPLPYLVAIDIMHQIAKGVYYLHDMQVAHLRLKPNNILCTSISMEDSMEDLDPCHIFKIMDYGTSQLEICSNPEHPELSEYMIGTLWYMAPEMINESKSPRYPFQADVWSFAMICSEILSGKVPYSNLKPKDFYDQINGIHGPSLRPNLPNNCEELTILIQKCWSQDPLQRPSFSNICDRLTNLKNSFLKRGSCALRDSKSIVNHFPRVDELVATPKEIRVDLDHQVSKVKGLLKMNYIGIVGVGGIGKTTLAKAILEDATITSSYHASCFIAKCKNYQSSYEILCEILAKLGSNCKPEDFEDAQKMMKELLIGKKVLLILDDVNKKALVHDIVPPNIVQASKGTTIIITTRRWSTIKSFVGIEGRLDIELLNEKAATTLFMSHLCWGVASLSPEFVALCKYVVEACNGLPLSLKVMGAFLRNKKRLRSWERALQRMARGRNLDGDEEIWNTLQISFDGLNDGVEKMMFLDVACFFCRDVYPSGISKAMILSMWSKNGILPVGELERLIDISLLQVNGNGDILEMHDQLRDMGRMIAKDTRIWKSSMILESEFLSKDVNILEGISLQGTMNHRVPWLKHDQNFDLKKLRVLILDSTLDNYEVHVDNLDFLHEIASQCSQLETVIIGNSQNWIGLPRILPATIATTLNTKISDLCGTCASLKILHLVGLEFLKEFPNEFASSNSLLRLNLSSCSNLVTLPKEVGNLSALNTLDLNGCSSLVALPKEVGNLSSLTTLNLRGCSILVALPNEVENLSSLSTLDLDGCSSLVALPKEVGNLSSLTTLNLKGCSSLVALPKEVGNLLSITTLDLSGCSSLLALPKELGILSSLTILNLRGCSSLATLPKEMGILSSLTVLNLRGCSSLATLPKEVGNLSTLTTLSLWGCLGLAVLPKEVGSLSCLTTLNLWSCSSLMALPKEVGNLSSLTSLDLWGCLSLAALPKEVGNLSFLTSLILRGCSSLVALPKEVENLSSLTTLDLSGCSSLVALPKEVKNLSSLTTLDLSGCLSLAAFSKEMENLSSLTTLILRGCSSLAALLKDVGNLSSLTTLDLSSCSSLVALPKKVGNLSLLTTLDLSGCSSLASLPKEVGNLFSLTILNVEDCSNVVALPKEVGNLSSLIILDLSGCSSLVALPKEVGNLSSLTTLDLSGCSSLVTLPKEMGSMSFLNTLNLEDCSNLTALPEEVENLSTLTTLILSGCSSLLVLPKEVGNLSSLTTLYLSYCSSLLTLPKEVGNLSSLTTLYLSYCSSLLTLPKEVGNLSSLTTLYLSYCSSLLALPKEAGILSSLTTLDLSGCSNLATLAKEVGNLSSLITLNLEDCSNLVALPKEVGNLTTLTTLVLIGCSSLTALPNEVGNLSCLTTLNLWRCSSLLALPKEVGNLSLLTSLYLWGCSSLATLPKEVGNLSSLTTLSFRGYSSLTTLPKEVGNLSSLLSLALEGCSSLVTLPKEVGNLSSLASLNLEDCSRLASLQKEVGNLSFLTYLNLSGCSNLVALPKEVGNLSLLTFLDLRRCARLVTLLKEVGNLSSLTNLRLDGCSSLVALPKEMGNLSLLTTLVLRGCSSLVALPKEVKNLSSLTILNLNGCSSLVALPKEVGNLTSLTTLDLSGCSSLTTLPEEVGNLSFLTILYLSYCSSLLALPNELGFLLSLTTIDLSGCSSLATLPKELGNLSSLTSLDLWGGSSLVALPKEVGNLSSLTTLILRGCSSLVVLPQEIGNLSSLTTLNLGRCSNLAVLPKEVGNLSSLTTLDLSGCSSLATLPKEVGNLSSLTTLNLEDSLSLVTLPKEVGNLSLLTTLNLEDCSNLADLPKEVKNLSSLTTFNLRGCSRLASLPKELGNLSSLTFTDSEECSRLANLPKEVEKLSSLIDFNLRRCSTLPKEVKNSSSLTTLNSKEYSSMAQVETTGDDEHVLKKQQEEAFETQLEVKLDLSKYFKNTTQALLLKILSYFTIKGLHILGSLLPWVQIRTSMFGQEVLFWNKGKVESKELITGRFLGQGCSGIFYETTWLQKSTIRLAKKDFPGVMDDTFVMEATKLFELKDHPNVVKTLCWTIDSRSCSLVMEYMKDNLSNFMRKKKEIWKKKGDQAVIGTNPSPFQLYEALDILLQIAIGIEYIHDKGIYHGDLKPNNVFLDWKEGQMLVKVVDFGLFETKRNTTLISQRAFYFQMIEWSAPELFEDFFNSMSEDLDFLWTTSFTELDPSTLGASCSKNGQKVILEKADSYSFGLISAFILGGEQMWPSQLSPQELRKKISSYGLRPKLPSKCPPKLTSLIYACWDIDPTCRPTFSIIRNKMQEIIKGEQE